ncbi:hypothetical protein [Sedimenticola sp.]|uniref:hypothetical protein n=1 Tax=Sedimenticola sp. TaxID=1940285 RepID=UPI003D0A9B44
MKVLTSNSVTVLDSRHRGNVLVAGSHGGLIAGALAAQAGVHAVILNDAGVGLDRAGIASLDLLASIGMAAATVSRRSAAIGQGEQALDQGVISYANRHAVATGVRPGDPCRLAAEKLCRAKAPDGELPPFVERRLRLGAADARPAVIGCDSVCLVRQEDAGAILVVGSHAAMHAAEPWTALGTAACAAFFHDAGCQGEAEGISRLPVLDRFAIPAAAVDHRTARIGDAASLWESGRLSYLNQHARQAGWCVGMTVQDVVALIQFGERLSQPLFATAGGRS